MDTRALEYNSLVQFKMLHRDSASLLPERGTSHAGAFDIKAPSAGLVEPGDTLLYGLGLAHQIHDDDLSFSINSRAADGTHRQIEVPFRLQGFLIPRSGLASKRKVRLFFAPCLIDHDYRGEIHVMIENAGEKPLVWSKGDRICQLGYIPMYMGPVMAVDTLTETERGTGGLGHTGGLSDGLN